METLFKKLSAMSATVILLILTSIFVVLFIYAKPAIKEYGLHFLVDPRWDVVVSINKPSTKKSSQKKRSNPNAIPTGNDLAGILPQGGNSIPTGNDLAGIIGNSHNSQKNTKVIYGGLIPIVGTILSTLIAMIFAVPLAMGISIFLAEIAPPFIAKPVGLAIELLAAIPSIIYGMWGLFYFGPFISHTFGGPSVSLLVAGLVLGIMIIPFMASLTRDSMKTTPNVLKESAYAMGATKFEVIKDVIFPYAKKGIIGSIILALGRALGETMAVAFVIGGVFSLPKSITDPTVSIPVVIANNFAESNGMSLNALYYLALILFVISFIVITLAKFYFLRDKK
jgi:phosphate transport system permease protein